MFITSLLPVLEEPESLMRPDPDQSLHGKCFQRSQGFTDSSDPASHLTRTVYVVGLHVLGKPFLELNKRKIRYGLVHYNSRELIFW